MLSVELLYRTVERGKMNTRIGIRIGPAERAKIENVIRNGSAQNLSDFIRKALEVQLQHSAPKVEDSTSGGEPIE